MRILALDIETIPCQSLPPECLPQFDPESVKLGNTKDPVKVEEKIAKERKKWSEGINKTMSLDPAFAQLCTFVGILYDTESEEIIKEETYQLREDDKHDDLDIVTNAWNLIQSTYRKRIPLVTFNGTSFDLPVLFFRAITQDVPIDTVMYRVRLTGRYTNSWHYDLMQILANWDRQRWHTFDFYARLFGVGGKADFDGSQVYDAYKNEQYDNILSYCRDEVVSMCQLFTRIEPWIRVTLFEGIEDKD